MKMEIPVESPEDGTVTVLQVGEGDQVSEDDPVATVETARRPDPVAIMESALRPYPIPAGAIPGGERQGR